MKKFAHVLPQISQVAYSDLATLEHSYNCGKYIDQMNVKGDIIEMGIAQGSNLISLMYYLLEMDLLKNREVWGFDSFEGIQLAGKNDTEQAGIGPIAHDVNVPSDELLKTSGVTAHSLESVRTNFSRWGVNPDVVNFVKGWVQKTLPVVNDQIERIAVLRLDMDVYDPTYFAIVNLWDKISKNGILIIDDWNLEGCRKAVYDAFAYLNIDVPPMYHVSEKSNPVYFIK